MINPNKKRGIARIIGIIFIMPFLSPFVAIFIDAISKSTLHNLENLCTKKIIASGFTARDNINYYTQYSKRVGKSGFENLYINTKDFDYLQSLNTRKYTSFFSDIDYVVKSSSNDKMPRKLSQGKCKFNAFTRDVTLLPK